MIVCLGLGVLLTASLSTAFFATFDGVESAAICQPVPAGYTAASQVVLGPPGTGQRVGATEYGGPGDPSSGTVGSSGVSLTANPDSYAELGGTTFASATAMGGLPYGTPLRITWGGHSVIAYKRDIGLGGGPIDGRPRVIDLWWELAGRLGIPYEDGRWSGTVRVERPALTGAANLLGSSAEESVDYDDTAVDAGCATGRDRSGVEVTSGPRATLLADDQATAPAGAPAAVKEIIAAGNEIVGKPYVYGGGHGLPPWMRWRRHMTALRALRICSTAPGCFRSTPI